MRTKINRSQCCVTILLSLEILVGFIFFGVTTYFYITLAAFMPTSENSMVLGQLSDMFILGFQLVVCFTVELLLWHYVCRRNGVENCSRWLILTNCFCVIVILFGLIKISFQCRTIEYLQKLYATLMFQGIDHYFSDPEWKLLWDKVQFRNECCGVLGMRDWKTAEWIPPDRQECFERSNSLVTMIPYTCCQRSSIECFETFAPHEIHDEEYNDSSYFNTTGCSQKFNFITESFTHIIIWLWVIVCIIQIIVGGFILFLTRLQKKSCTFLDCSENCAELPVVIVKYPKNVRCVALTEDESYTDEFEFGDKCSSCQLLETTIHQGVRKSSKGRINSFVH